MGTYHINLTQAGWELKKEGATRASKRAATKDEIMRLAATFLAEKRALLMIHRADGALQEKRSYLHGFDRG